MTKRRSIRKVKFGSYQHLARLLRKVHACEESKYRVRQGKLDFRKAYDHFGEHDIFIIADRLYRIACQKYCETKSTTKLQFRKLEKFDRMVSNSRTVVNSKRIFTFKRLVKLVKFAGV